MNELTIIQQNNLTAEASNKLTELIRAIKALEEEEKQIREVIFKHMEANNIVKIENDDLRINFVIKSDRESFDTKTFKVDHPELYEEYVKMTPQKPSLVITLK